VNQLLLRKKLKSRLKSGNACYHSVQNLLSSSLLRSIFGSKRNEVTGVEKIT
jgi:hypothetical protein